MRLGIALDIVTSGFRCQALDLDTKEALDRALGEFPGTVIMGSHDRYLLSKVPTKIAEMSRAGMTMP